MKLTIKSIVAMLLVAMVMTTFAMPCFAEDRNKPISVGEIGDNVVYGNTDDTKDMTEMAGKVIGLIRNVAVIVGVILITVLGIKYMMGSAEEKAGYQKSMVPLVVGIVVVMASTQIASMVFNLLNSN